MKSGLSGDDVRDQFGGIPLSLFIAMSCLAALGIVYSAAFVVFNIVYRHDRYARAFRVSLSKGGKQILGPIQYPPSILFVSTGIAWSINVSTPSSYHMC